MSTPAENVIAKCGGHQTVAEWLDVDLSRVYRWTYPRERGGTGGLIPSKHQRPLLERARLEGVQLEPADFLLDPPDSVPPPPDETPADTAPPVPATAGGASSFTEAAE